MSTKKRTEFEGKPKIIAQAGAITMNFGKEMGSCFLPFPST
jgi:hypothetical protein